MMKYELGIMKLKDLENKKIVILGFGKEGQDTYLALRKLFPNKVLAIADQKCLTYDVKHLVKSDRKVELYFGKDYLKALKNYQVIIKTPGIPEKTIKPYLKKESVLTSQTEIFFDNFPGRVIGITGTKGKGTTSALIYQMLKQAGRKTHLVGNIGQPIFQQLLKADLDDIFVYELSSHQLQGLKKSPQIAVFLNLYPDHLDYYQSFSEYQKAKENITLHQSKKDWLIYNADDPKVKKIAQKSKAQKIPFSLENNLKAGWLTGDAKIIKKQEIPLKGSFNILNIIAASLVGQLMGMTTAKIKKAIKEFKGLPHRLEFAGKYKGIEFYNDSMSTIPEAAIAALQTFRGKRLTLIAGGSEKGSAYRGLAQQILKSKIKTLILFPGTGEKIQKQVLIASKKTNQKPGKIFIVKSMREAIKIAFQETKKTGVCLLSPGSASFNLFKDYQQRGKLFKKWVKHYA